MSIERKKLKIAVPATGLGHVARGVETWANDLGGALDKGGTAVTLFKGGGQATRPFERVIRCVQRDAGFARFVERWALQFAWRFGFGSPYQTEQTTFALSFIPLIRAGKYDVVHLQDAWLALLLERTQWFHGAKVILAHGTEEPVEYLNHFAHVQELSPFYLQRHGPLNGRRWFAIPNFVDVEQFRPRDKTACRDKLGLSPDTFIVLSVGALRRSRKRMDWLVSEFAGLAAPNAQLVIAGAAEKETPEFIAAAQATLGDRVIIRQNLPHDQMADLYGAADVFVLCSLEEILGIAFLEAMACGVPCIGHTYPVTEWVIGDGGECVDMQQTGALTQSLLRFQEKPYQFKRAQAARSRAESVYSREVVIPQMLAMYSAVLEK